MKKFRCIGMIMILCAGLLAGCGESFTADENTVYVGKNGKVLTVDVEAFEADYYSEAELQDYIRAEVDAYTETAGKNSVKLSKLTVENGIAKMEMSFKTVEDYTAFNGIELYQGNTVNALAAGYRFDTDFTKVVDGAFAGSATKDEIYEQDDLKVVVIKANTNVQIDGEIQYVSTENVTVTGTNTVSISDGSDEEDTSFETDVYTYIVYK